MKFIVLGLLVWSVVHLFPALAPKVRARLEQAWGENTYKGAFSILIQAATILMVYGWRQTQAVPVYLPVAELKPLSIPLVVMGFVLMGAAQYPTRIK